MQRRKFVDIHIPVIQFWFTQYVQYIALHNISIYCIELYCTTSYCNIDTY